MKWIQGWRGTLRLLILAGTMASAAMFAQEYRGKVQGMATDASDAAVAGAVVRLENVESGVAVSRVTDGYGRYLFDLVVPGMYRLVRDQHVQAF